MPDSQGQLHTDEILLVAGEASGDLHGANLVRALHQQMPCLRFSGMGGRELRAAGMEILHDAAGMAVVGATEVLSHLGDILRARRTLIQRLRQRPPALLILVDYPDFNLWLAATAKRLGIPIFYYISPQLWAWRSGRVRTIRRLVDRMAVILPFEREWYARHGMSVDYVGHPLVDTVDARVDRQRFLAEHSIAPENALVGLLPGSRKKEVVALLPDFLAGAEKLACASRRPLTFLLPQASTIDRSLLDQHGLADSAGRLDVRVIGEDRYSMMAACDAAVAASGTVMLELALLDTPTVAAYRTSRNTYLLGRLLIRHLTHFTLVNLIGGRAIIPELLQDEITPERIAQELGRLLHDRQARHQVLAGLAEVRERLGGPGASARAAESVLALLRDRRA
jgi:lipid-A-disaccharide synthase